MVPRREVSALAQLGIVAGVVVATLVVESLVYADQRREIRAEHLRH